MAKKKKLDALEAIFDQAMERVLSGSPEKKRRAKYDRQRFDNDYDAIYEAYLDPDKRLTAVQLRQLSRWKLARQWYSEFDPKNDAEVVEALRAEFGISSKQAYTDIANCKRLFGSIDVVNVEFEKVMMIERVKRRMKEMANLPDGFGYPSYMKAEKLLADLLGLTKEKQTLPEPKIVEVVMTANPLELGFEPIENVELHIKSFWKKKEEQQLLEIQDVDFDELINNPRNEQQHQREQ